MSLLLLLRGAPSAELLPIVRCTAVTRNVVASKHARKAAAALLLFALAGGNNVVPVPAGELTLAGQTPTVAVSNNQTIAVPVGNLTVTGLAPTVTATAEDGFLLLAPRAKASRQVTTLARRTSYLAVEDPAGNTVSVPFGSLTLTGFAPTVTSGAATVLPIPLGSLTLTGFAPTVDVTQDLLIPPRTRTSVHRVAEPRKLSPRWLLNVSQTGPVTVSVPVGSLTLSGLAPAVVTSGSNAIAVPVGSLTLAGFAPAVNVSGNQTLAVPLGSLTLTGLAPAVVAGGGNAIQVPVGSLTLAGLAPTVAVGGNQVVAVPAGALTLSGLTPTVFASNRQVAIVSLGSLTLQGFGPSVVVQPAPQSMQTLLAAGDVTVFVAERDFEYTVGRE
jgi:hypothetical protein